MEAETSRQPAAGRRVRPVVALAALRRRRYDLLAVAVVMILAGCGDDSGEGASDTTTSSAATTPLPASATLRATLSGAAEVPGPGDSAGSGSASITIQPPKGQLCYELAVSGIAAPDKAHIHRGRADQAGPIVVNFAPPASGRSEGCVGAGGALISQMLTDPAGFYVNVHNGPYPAGAVRGQLAR